MKEPSLCFRCCFHSTRRFEYFLHLCSCFLCLCFPKKHSKLSQLRLLHLFVVEHVVARGEPQETGGDVAFQIGRKQEEILLHLQEGLMFVL